MWSQVSVRQWLQDQLSQRWPDATIEVTDLTGGDDHFEAVVVSPEFQGKNQVARHRLVYAALGDAMKSRVHALSLKTWAPEEKQLP